MGLFSKKQTKEPENIAKNTDALSFNALYEHLPLIEFEPDGTIIGANQHFLSAMGYSLDEIQGKHHKIFCFDSYTASLEYSSFWRNLAGGRPMIAEVPRKTKSVGPFCPAADTHGIIVTRW